MKRANSRELPPPEASAPVSFCCGTVCRFFFVARGLTLRVTWDTFCFVIDSALRKIPSWFIACLRTAVS